jgi:hypothetical protein
VSKHRRRQIDAFAMVPVIVLQSIACTTLPNYALRVLFAFAAQFRGRNNGDLALTWSMAKTFGIASREHHVKGIALLLDHGLIVKTRQGGKKPLGPTLYALTWHPVDECNGKLDVSMSMTPSHAWSRWTPSSSAPSPENQQHCRRTGSALPADSLVAKSALPADRIGTAGGQPSRQIGTAGGQLTPLHRHCRQSSF